jgi:hypothetical protein
VSTPDGESEDRTATLRWRIDKEIGLYQFYLDIAVKAAIFLMAVTGAIASYVLANTDKPVLSLALAFPALMNAGFAVLFFYSVAESRRLFELHAEASRELAVPEFNLGPLRSVCQLLSLICGAATVGLLGLAVYLLLAQFRD